MPTLISRGAASAKGFGLTNGALNLTTVTFTSNGTWVAPTGVFIVPTLTGRGQDGSSQPVIVGTSYGAVKTGGTFTYPAYADWSGIYGTAVSVRDTIAAAIGGFGPSSYLALYQILVSATNSSWEESTAQYDDLSGVYITGVSSLSASGGAATSGNIVGPSLPAGVSAWSFAIYAATPSFVGASSTGLGQTFPGGNNTTAPTLTFNNIAVTPGTSYPIVVAPGGFVTIQYLAP